MGELVNVCFKRRQVIIGPLAAKLEVNERPDRESDPIEHWRYMLECVQNRFGDTQPAGGCIYVQDFKNLTLDSYGRGNVHCSVWQYLPRRGEGWNQPFPFMADLPAVEAFLKANSGLTLTLGHKSDPFIWMDQKYGITKSILEMAAKYNVRLICHTMSDLCGHDDYVNLLRDGKHSVVMQMGLPFSSPGIERIMSPGAPSVERREKAVERLSEAGVSVSKVWVNLSNLNPRQMKEYRKRGGK